MTRDVVVQADRAQEEAKYESQSTTIITKEDIEKKQAKSIEDVIFSEVGVTRTVDAMGKVGISIRGADPRHTLMLIDGQPVLSDVSKQMGGSDEAMRIGAENIERIEIIRGAATAKYGPDAIGGVINIITKAPADSPSFRINAEARYHKHDGTDENKNTWPSNYYMRADTGKIGNTKFSVFGSKRDIMPVYSDERAYKKGSTWYFEDFRPSLRYYGDVKNMGATGEVDINANHKISFRVMNEKENLERRNKSAEGIGGLFEPMQIFKRDMSRDTYAFTYTGKGGTSDWKIDVNYGKMKENDTTLTTYYGAGHDQYSGKNSLATVDWLEHKQLDVKATINTAINDRHLLTYGVGYTDERADGTRLKNVPEQNRWIKSINPWDYDKSLWVPTGQTKPDSNVHNWEFKQDKEGLIWDKNKEYYGMSTLPSGFLTYEDAQKIDTATFKIPPELKDKYAATDKLIREQNNITQLQADGKLNYVESMFPVLAYYGLFKNSYEYEQNKNLQLNGQYYGQGFEERENQVAGGEARIQKRHAFLQDSWQVNDDTIITPVLRVDDSDMFGGHVTANLGMTHNLGGNPHRRLKLNAGTGYAEPGMGELYYNWEMYGSSGGGRYGWYWIGNPNLKPEKSLNFDISLEGESNKTYSRVSIFHNTIDDYMTSYFTGQLIDFNFNGASQVLNADRIYSFKNIGKAEITGFEAEVQQRFNDHWSAKVGYAWLHAINKSDPDMPRQLLDRPQHKVDLSLNYEDKNHGWRVALWGDYYIHMLDSNSGSTNGTAQDSDGNYIRQKAVYQKKTFGIWNIMVEKDFGKDFTAYVGVDNLFNYRDDDRAYQDRLYRLGVNVKLGGDTPQEAAEKAKKKAKKKTAKQTKAANIIGFSAMALPATTSPVTDFHTTALSAAGTSAAGSSTMALHTTDWFLPAPSSKDAGRKAGDVDFIGDYRIRSNMFGGGDNAAMSLTTTASADMGSTKNLQNSPCHGLEQRLRLGIDAQLGDNTNLVVEGSSGNTIDTRYSKADKRGLHDVRLEKAELNQKANKWDFTIGRLTERMGTTGYWFGKEYTGIRTTWTDQRTQVRIGYGDFSAATGITDSAYTHQEKAVFYRSPSTYELLGVNLSDERISIKYENEDDYKSMDLNYIEKFNHAADELTGTAAADARLNVLQNLNQLLLAVSEEYPDDGAMDSYYGGTWYTKYFQTIKDPNQRLPEHPRYSGSGSTAGQEIDPKWQWTGTNPYSGYNQKIIVDGTLVYLTTRRGDVGLRDKYKGTEYAIHDKSWGEILDPVHGKDNIYDYLKSLYKAVIHDKGVNAFGNMTEQQALDDLYCQFAGGVSDMNKSGSVLDSFYEALDRYDPTNGTDRPVGVLKPVIKVVGTLLKQDVIPAIDRAAFVQVRQKVGDKLGLQAWYLRSMGEGYHKTGMEEIAGGWGNYDQEMDIANVFGIGAQYKLGASYLSFDWGINRAATGRYFHGGRDAYGRYTGGGSAPTFWVARVDVGKADTERPGSWNAFADYKYFEHGSFFGGNGTEGVPDRYLDGIRSFTLGAGYVPAKNFLLEAFYTFGAKSTSQRDTLYGPEHFTLGDYTRIQATYRF
ncbi:MAG: TonB-dependent receptor [Megasphaera cerevisiae]|jgi:outer membrane receptor for ferrienterochelin and colicin|nr:TonB-dependent receptor [Megasphaera cerevisiae]